MHYFAVCPRCNCTACFNLHIQRVAFLSNIYCSLYVNYQLGCSRILMKRRRAILECTGTRNSFHPLAELILSNKSFPSCIVQCRFRLGQFPIAKSSSNRIFIPFFKRIPRTIENHTCSSYSPLAEHIYRRNGTGSRRSNHPQQIHKREQNNSGYNSKF